MNKHERSEWERLFSPAWEMADHEKRGNAPESWMNSADKLRAIVRLIAPTVDAAHRAAVEYGKKRKRGEKLLFPRGDDMKAIQPLAMLRAMAVECMLKALWIRKNGPIVEGGKLISRAKSHDLVRLAQDAGVELAESEVVVLTKLGLFLTVHGRYPIGVAWDDDRKVREKTGDIAPITTWTMEDVHVGEALVKRLEILLQGHGRRLK